MSAAEIPVTPETFPAQLKELREEQELSQQKLAKRAQVSQQTISAIENGRVEPSLPILVALAVALGVVLRLGKLR